MYFRLIYDDMLAQGAYLIGCQRTGEAVVVDPQRDIDRLVAIAAAQKLRIVAIAETHIHADYLSGARELAEHTGARLFVSDEGDADWKYQWLGKKRDGGSYPHQLLKDGSVFRVGHIEIAAVHTPGHTPEHLSFMVTDRGGGADEPMGLLTGDFVFVGDMGRPDLLETAAGQVGVKEIAAGQLFNSARWFVSLPEFLQVWPAHGAGSACGKSLGAVPQSTVGYEKRFNAALQAGDQSTFVHGILEGQPEPPLYFARMKRLNMEGPPLLASGDSSLPAPREISGEALKRLDARSHVVLDTRAWARFKAGHVRGSLWCPVGSNFPTVAGSYIAEDEPIVLICDPAQTDQAIRALVRVGLDRIEFVATPEVLEASGADLIQTREIDAATFLREMQDPKSFVLDVRRATEFEAGHVPGSLNIAHTRLLAHLGQVPGGQPLLVHCQGGTRSAFAASLLERHGFTPTNIAGGFGAYERAGGEVVREAVHA